ncbi:glycine betaine ABC transporter substrate-binding protein [Methanococcoides sp. NM1]|uniref:glycine betaine ABC transporter substrate-binding protein n=1 Tax=Methanococcoides sp. NM1 TaxID=1201013 RepID=UPI001084328F|nr:glycine betaine ABC transporter substrate-binding protein [Methanococcoides sp. NM1]
MKSVILILVLMMTLAAAGCVQQEEETPSEEAEPVIIGYPPWDDARANTFVLKQVLESEGYEVETVNADLGAVFQGVAQGDIDIYASAWLPTTQGLYWDRYGNDLDYVNNISTGAKIGLVVPTYVTIDSINELNENKDKFEGVVQGIEPGAGIMATTEVAMEEYNLDYVLSASSTVGMATELQDSIDNEEWMVVTLWQPHWAFARMDLKFLEDPKNVYGEGDNLVLVARKDLSEDRPDVYEIISRYEMDISDVGSIMLDLDQGLSPEEAAAKWIENNPEKVNEWLGE